MAKGENIFKRKDGRWEARYEKGREASGKIRYGYCYAKTYKAAKEKVTQAKAALMFSDNTAPAGSHSLSHYCDEWLKLNKNRIKASSYAKYSIILEKHIKPAIGKYNVSELNTLLIENFSDQLLHQKNLSPKSVKDTLVLLRSVIRYSEKQFPGAGGQIDIIYPKEQKHEMRVLTQKEQLIFIQYLLDEMDDCKFGVLLALLTGIRIGELCALRWGDISLEEKTVHIHASMQRLPSQEPCGSGKTQLTITLPKSAASVRTIPLTSQMAFLCGKMCKQNKNYYVVTGTEKYMEPRALQYRFSKYTKMCGLEQVHFHTLRHTFATRCVEAGFEIKTLSEILGHSNPSVTLQRYVHSSMEMKRKNMDKLQTVGL